MVKNSSLPSLKIRPSPADLKAAVSRTVPDVIAPDLQVLFCGINPGLYTAWLGHHFGRPGNRFWPALFAGGFTPRLFDPREDHQLLNLGWGITNLVARPTLQASELSRAELLAGKDALVQKIQLFKPRWLAVLGITSYRQAFAIPKAKIGLQSEKIGDTRIWVLPNPSGLNAHHTPQDLAHLFSTFHSATT